MLNSMVCRYADFGTQWYQAEESNLAIRKIYPWHSSAKFNFVNRKFWEWCAIARALSERQRLQPGMRGLGFAVGTEPLSAYFASRDCKILATDLHAESSDGGWISTGQHAASLDALFQPALVHRTKFDENVAFRPADMRNLANLTDKYDFVWSSCALEHLGTLQAGVDFILASSALLAPGGVGVHTTEFNVQSNSRTVESGPNVIYREQDILSLGLELSRRGYRLSRPNFDSGSHPFDIDFDRPPYMDTDRRHIKLEIDGFVSTSMLLIVESPIAT